MASQRRRVKAGTVSQKVNKTERHAIEIASRVTSSTALPRFTADIHRSTRGATLRQSQIVSFRDSYILVCITHVRSAINLLQGYLRHFLHVSSVGLTHGASRCARSGSDVEQTGKMQVRHRIVPLHATDLSSMGVMLSQKVTSSRIQ